MPSFQHILALFDPSVQGIHAAWRAARIAREQGASVHLLQWLPGLDTQPSSRFGPGSPLARARDELAHLADEIEFALGITATHAVSTEAPLAAARGAWRDADLIVVPSPPRAHGLALPPWDTLLHGPLPLRLLREAGVPVLAARRASGVNYRRVLAAVPLDGVQALPLLALARRLCAGGVVEVFHALSLAAERTLRAAEVGGALIAEQRRVANDRASAAVQALAREAGLPMAVPVVRHGEPARQMLLHQAEVRASLMVVGMPRRGRLAELLLGGTALRVLAQADCDLLCLPQLTRLPSARRADRRLRAAGA